MTTVADSTTIALYPITLAAIGIVASMIGTFVVRTNDESKISSALTRGLLVASALFIAGTVVLALLIPDELSKISEKAGNDYGPWGATGAVWVVLRLRSKSTKSE